MRRNILTFALVGGIATALAGFTFAAGLTLMMMVGGMGGALTGADAGLLYAALALAAGIVAPALGLIAAWRAWQGLRDQPSRPFRLPGWGLLLILLTATLAAGQLFFSTGVDGLAVIAHIVVATVAALMMLSIPLAAARRQGVWLGRRAGALGLAWGALGGVGLALVVELVLAVGLVAGLFAALSMTNPGFIEGLRDSLQSLPQSPGADPLAEFGPLLSSPLVLVVGLLGAALVVPLIEELAKSLLVPVVKWAGRPLTRLDAFLLGATAGAGFTLIEGITNGATALSQPEGWAVAMAARSGVAVIHVVASALAGLAWHSALVERRRARGLGLFALAVALHGAWNAGAVLMAWLGLRVSAGASWAGGIFGNLGLVAIVGGMGLLFLASLIALAALPGRLIQRI